MTQRNKIPRTNGIVVGNIFFCSGELRLGNMKAGALVVGFIDKIYQTKREKRPSGLYSHASYKRGPG